MSMLFLLCFIASFPSFLPVTEANSQSHVVQLTADMFDAYTGKCDYDFQFCLTIFVCFSKHNMKLFFSIFTLIGVGFRKCWHLFSKKLLSKLPQNLLLVKTKFFLLKLIVNKKVSCVISFNSN